MSSDLKVVPVVKVEFWQQWLADLAGPSNAEYQDYLKRYELDRERCWLVQGSDGGHLGIILSEGSGASTVMQKFANSEHPFDQEFKTKVGESHGIDFNAPPPPPPQLVFDVSK